MNDSRSRGRSAIFSTTLTSTLNQFRWCNDGGHHADNAHYDLGSTTMSKATQNVPGAMMSVYLLLILGVVTSAQWIDYPANGFATMTHYTLPRDYVAACGCTPSSTHYPTAALSQMAFGSSAAYGTQYSNYDLLSSMLTGCSPQAQAAADASSSHY